MEWKKELKTFLLFATIFLVFYFLPIGTQRFDNAIFESLELTKWYAREHVLLCLIPAFFISGAISVFVKQETVLKYLGSRANRFLAYGVASVSGGILAVCSCTVLPLFAGIYHQGAGIGPATAFLYSGPAINVLAIVLSAKVLGLEIGFARGIFAIVFSIVIGLLMEFLFKKDDITRLNQIPEETEQKNDGRKLWQDVIFFLSLVGILVFANWGKPVENSGIWYNIFVYKWTITALFSVLLGFVLILWFKANWKIILITALVIIITK